MSLYFAILVSAVLGGFGLAAYLWDRVYVRQYRDRFRENVYHCMKCNSVYSSRAAGDSAVCPVCGYRNGRLKF